MPSPITVVLADDHPLIQLAIRDLVATAPDIELVDVVRDGYAARAACEQHVPDVLLMAVAMPGPPPQETVRHLHGTCPSTKIVVLTAFDDDEYAFALSAAGVEGYVLKEEEVDAVTDAIRTVAQGEAWFSQRVANKILRSRRRQEEAGLDVLTPREREILDLVAAGWDNLRISAHLSLAEQTVRNYVSGLYGKIGANSREDLVAWARRRKRERPPA